MEKQAHGHPGAWRVDDLVVDAGARTVTRGETVIDLPLLSFELLVALVQAAPSALSTDEAMHRVWKRVVVSPATVAKRVELLRQALGDDSDEPRYVALVRGYGYRLVPEPVPLGDTGKPSAPPESHRGVRAWPALLVVAALVVAAAAWWWLAGPEEGAPAHPPQRSIAVLPFNALGEDAQDQRFADGLTEEISSALARTGDLRVTGRTSAALSRGPDRDHRAIGELLGVAHLLEGSVRREGARLTVVARLVDTGDGFQRWSESYDQTVADALDIQRAIAAAVAEALRVTLSGGMPAEPEAMTGDPQAYALYLEARGLMPYPFSPEPGKAQELLERAVERDPAFASAWALLGAIHVQRLLLQDPTYTLTPAQSVAVAGGAVRRALDIDPASGVAIGVDAGIAWLIEGDDTRAAERYAQAIRLAPWQHPLMLIAGEFARTLGQLELSRQLGEYVVQRDPLCPRCRYQLARTLVMQRDYAAALDTYRVLAAMNPPHEPVFAAIPDLLLVMGDASGARDVYATREDITPCGPAMVAHALGEAAQAESLWAACVEALKDQPYRWLRLSQVAARLGKHDEAFAQLEAARDDFPLFRMEFQRFWMDPLYDDLRGDPRWQALLEHVDRSPERIEAITPPLAELTGPFARPTSAGDTTR